MKTKLKISETAFKEYLISKYVDENGNKVSDRFLWGAEDFFEYTGMYGINKYTNKKQMVSTGTISYWKKKLQLKEEDIYRYHTSVTNRIKISFEEWSRKNNKGYSRQKTNTRDSIKRKLILYTGLPDKYKHMSLDEVCRLATNLWKNLGFDEKEEMRKFYRSDVDG